MMKNKKVIVFLESEIFFLPANFGKWRIWCSCALDSAQERTFPTHFRFDPDRNVKPPYTFIRISLHSNLNGNTLSNEPSFVALSQIITKRPPVENCAIQLTQLFRVKSRDPYTFFSILLHSNLNNVFVLKTIIVYHHENIPCWSDSIVVIALFR
jgi:hypothetical protein